MMNVRLACFALLSIVSSLVAEEGIITLKVNDLPLVHYQAEPLQNPAGGDKFQGSNFFHPLKTPSGFTVTEANPKSHHHHHFGLWWPWKYIEVENGRKVLCWELQKGDGLIEAKESTFIANRLTAKSLYTDRKAPGGPRTLLHETVLATVSDIIDKPAQGYWLDLEIIHEVTGDQPLEISQYRYSGFTLRGTDQWAGYKASVLTSEGLLDKGIKHRKTPKQFISDTNFTSARWVRTEGPANESTAGILLMSHPSNHNHPEKLRTWGNREIFINFNPVQDKSWTFEPGKTYTRKYRVFIYDGNITAEEAESLWQSYSGKQKN